MKPSYVKVTKIKQRIILLCSVALCTLFIFSRDIGPSAIIMDGPTLPNPPAITTAKTVKKPVVKAPVKKQISKMSAVQNTTVQQAQLQLPVFPYGAVYFRKHNPPSEDWETDYKTAADLGVNMFRHWFLWNVIENTPGKYDWSDYDKQMDLAAKNGIVTIIAEHSNQAPVWYAEAHPKWRTMAADGTYATGVSVGVAGAAPGGSSSICMDNPEAYKAQQAFQTALVMRYRNHPSTIGYDIWNESLGGGGGGGATCYCPYSQAKWHDWLKAKYGTLEDLAKALHIYSFGKWENIPPGGEGGGGAASVDAFAIDWNEYTSQRGIRFFKERVELFRKLDPNHLVTGHKDGQPTLAANYFAASKILDYYGTTWVQSRHGDSPWMLFQGLDIVRGEAGNKPWWHAEAEAGSLWMQPQVPGRAREDGRMTLTGDVTLWNMQSMALGAKGILYPRWRPILDGPLFGAFGPMGMDGSITERSLEASKVAKWANVNPQLWKSNPVRGDVAILLLPEAQTFSISASAQYYTQSVQGVYRAFFDSNIQPDFIQLESLKDYPVVYLPFPIALKQSTVDMLTAYVQNGGKLICEGTPAYWGENAHVGEVQPNLGLDKLFGAKEKFVEFVPDLLENLTLNVRGSKIGGRYFRQEYTAAGGIVVGTYDNGNAAAIENASGRGKTLLIGTFPGGSYVKSQSADTKKFFAGLLEWAGVSQRVIVSDTQVQVRLHEGAGGKYLWVVNPTRGPKDVTIQVTDSGVKAGKDLWGGKQATMNGKDIKVAVDSRSVAVIPLQ